MSTRPSQPVRRATDRLRGFVVLFGNVLEREHEFDFDQRLSIGPSGFGVNLDDDVAVFALEEMLERELLAEPIAPAIRDEAFARLMATREFPSDRPHTREVMEGVFARVDAKGGSDAAA